MNNKKLIVSAAMLLAASFSWQAKASTTDLTFAGPGVSANITLTYGTAADMKYPQALEVTGISGTFSDWNNGLNIVSAPITSLVAITHDTPEPTNLLAPNDFSRFAVASGTAHGSLTYDNLYYPGGSPQTASDYPFSGGGFDIYGLMFNIGGGQVVDVWSNGTMSGIGPFDYGVGVATSATSLDYVGGGVSLTPEPGAASLLGGGLLSILLWRLRSRLKSL